MPQYSPQTARENALLAFGERHGLATLALLAVLLAGVWAYFSMPRAQYPEVKLNWVTIVVVWPEAAAHDVERWVTRPLENALRRVDDIEYLSATSRDHVSTLLLRFADISPRRLERRMQALARAIQAEAGAFPAGVHAPQIVELTTSSVFHTALVLIADPGGELGLVRLAESVRRDLEAMPGVGRVLVYGDRRPELVVEFDAAAARALHVDLEAMAQQLTAHARDAPAGEVGLEGRRYNLVVQGMGADTDALLALHVPTTDGGSHPLGAFATVHLAPSTGRERVSVGETAAVLLAIGKRENANTVDLLRRIEAYIAARNADFGRDVLILADDQSENTRLAIRAMEYNALLGLLMVLGIAWLFLGRRIAFLVSLGVPFALAAMFLILHLTGQTLNVAVLLGVAIVLGIPLDDAVVVAEAISMRMHAGMERLRAVREGLAEVARPVITSVLATTAAFAPLLFMPGILGEFMFTVPLTVILALFASLIASLWILPTHVAHCRLCAPAPGRMRALRVRYARLLRHQYGRGLLWAFRHPVQVGLGFSTLVTLVLIALVAGWLKTQWFLSDPLRVFNVNVRMHVQADIEQTLRAAQAIERRILAVAAPGEVRASFVIAGLLLTPTEPLPGEHLGQLTISLAADGPRTVGDFVAAARAALSPWPQEVEAISFQVLSADLPTLSGITARLSGEDAAQLVAASRALRVRMESIVGLGDIQDDAPGGRPRLALRLHPDAAGQAGLDPARLAAYVRLHHSGVPLARLNRPDLGEIDLVLRARAEDAETLQAWLNTPIRMPSGVFLSPAKLFDLAFEDTPGPLRRVNHWPTTTLRASVDHTQLSTAAAVRAVESAWAAIAAEYPGVRLRFGGEFEDVRQSLAAIARFAALGGALMFALLMVQFRSVRLALVILATLPMAFVGASLGLLSSGLPLSLYTLYGGIALGGVAVNASILLVAAARDRSALGFSPVAAAFHAARRRLVPILITTLSIIAGLISVALGLAGDSVLWGPLAATLVWGLALATPMTLFATPLLYVVAASGSERR